MLREAFPCLHQQVNGKDLVYFDNAATAMRPQVVIDAVNDYYCHNNANIHRGVHCLSGRATDLYEQARGSLARLINAPSPDNLIFVRGCTEGVNLVAQTFVRERLQPGDEILISTNKGRVIRVAVKEIRTASRNTQGVRIIKLSGDEKVVSAIKIDDNLI